MKAILAGALLAVVLATTSNTVESGMARVVDAAPDIAMSPVDSQASSPVFRGFDLTDQEFSFYFTRGAYSGSRGFGGASWAVDYPDADIWISNVLRRLTGVDVAPFANVVRLDDPRLRRYPFLYVLEVGYMRLSRAEVQGLRDYLLAGGFLMVDDFWGSWEWANFQQEIGRVLPEYEIVELPLDHPVFSSYYAIDEIVQVPNIGNGINFGLGYPGARTWEQDGIEPRCFGIFDEEGRLMVVINWNTDLGDAWEHAEDPRYPLQFSTFAYQMVANFAIYAMTH